MNGVVQRLHVEQRPELFKVTAEAEVIAWFKRWLEQRSVRIWVAEIDATPIGYVVAIIRHVSENLFCAARHWCEVDQIAVHPDFRRRGAARALLNAAVEYARTEGLPGVEANSWSFNHDAHRTFEALGFSRKTLRFERPI